MKNTIAVSGGRIEGTQVEIPGLQGADGRVTLGFRAEDAQVVSEGGENNAPIYTLELLGDATMVTVRLGEQMVSVKTGKSYRAEIGDPVSIRVPVDICHLFHSGSGERFAG